MIISRKVVNCIIFLALLSVAFTFYVAVQYMPLRVDGSWSAYPAISMVRHGSAIDQFLTIAELFQREGLSIKFGVFDIRSLRLYPMALWFETFGISILSCRIFSFLEYLSLVGAFALFIRGFTDNSTLIILATCFFGTSSSVLFLIEDLRPDLMVTALATAGFSLLHGGASSPGNIRFWVGSILLLSTTLVWFSSAISLTITFVFLVLEALREKRENRITQLSALAALALVGLALFLNRRLVNDHLFGVIPANVNNIFQMIRDLWDIGFEKILFKEVHRWRGYFLFSNLPSLLMLLYAAGLSINSCFSKKHKSCPDLMSLAGSILAGVGVMVLFDPNSTSYRLLAIAPFFYAFIVLCVDRDLPGKRAAYNLLVACIGVTLIFSISVPIKKAVAASTTGYDNARASELVRKYTSQGGQRTVVVGPTALFPYLSFSSNLLIIDDRVGKHWGKVSIERVRHIFIDDDFMGFNFIEAFEKRFPGVGLQLVESIGSLDRFHYLGVYAVQPRLPIR